MLQSKTLTTKITSNKQYAPLMLQSKTPTTKITDVFIHTSLIDKLKIYNEHISYKFICKDKFYIFI